jgi:hypothetical protein
MQQRADQWCEATPKAKQDEQRTAEGASAPSYTERPSHLNHSFAKVIQIVILE